MRDPFTQKLVITVLGVGCLVVSNLVLGEGIEGQAVVGVAGAMFGWAWAPRPGDGKGKG